MMLIAKLLYTLGKFSLFVYMLIKWLSKNFEADFLKLYFSILLQFKVKVNLFVYKNRW